MFEYCQNHFGHNLQVICHCRKDSNDNLVLVSSTVLLVLTFARSMMLLQQPSNLHFYLIILNIDLIVVFSNLVFSAKVTGCLLEIESCKTQNPLIVVIYRSLVSISKHDIFTQIPSYIGIITMQQIRYQEDKDSWDNPISNCSKPYTNF